MNAAKLSLTRSHLPSEQRLRWRGVSIIAIPAVCLFTSIFTIAALRSITIAATEQEKQSLRTILDSDRLLRVLVDGETGVRGYLITQRSEFLEPYLQAKIQLPALLHGLSARLPDSSTQYQQFQPIPTLAQQQMVLLEQILKTSQSAGATARSSPVLSSQLLQSKSNMDNLRQELAQFADREQRLQRDREVKVRQWRRLTTIVQWSSLGIGLIGSGAALYLFDRLDRELVNRASRLRESNAYLRTVFDNVVDGILILDERGYVQSANAAASEIFGYEEDEVKGLHLQRLMAEVFAEDSGQVMSSLVGTKRDKLRLQQETVGRCKNEKTFPMEFAISQMLLENESLFIAIVRDISDRKLAQDTLVKQAQLLDLANDTIMICHLDDTIVYWNQGAERLYGWTADEALGQSVHSLLKTDFSQPLGEIQEIVLKQGHWNGELTHFRRDGTRMVVSSSWTLQRDEMGQPSAYLEIAQDITERKRQDAALHKSEELYRTLVKNFPNGAVFLFDQDLRYQIAEGTGLATVNLDREDLTGKTIWETLPPQTAQLLEPIYREALAGQATVTEVPFGDRIYRVHVLPVTNETGEVLSGMTMTQDITESKRAEAALRSRAEELARITAILAQTTANLEKRNAELDQFAYIVSHDLKAPLRAIANLGQWIAEDLEDRLTEETRHHLDLLQGRVQRMEALINGLLQYSRVGRVRTELELVDVEGLLGEVIDSLAPP
ncbi:MAG TPA: PAS domain S-box protein, partial [Allocoleopsis sp.]